MLLPLVPVIVKGKDPVLVVGLVLIVSVEEPALVETGLGLKDAVAFEGSPLTLSDTELDTPFDAATVTL